MADQSESTWIFDRQAIRAFHLATHREQLDLAVSGGLLTSAEARALAEAFEQSESLERTVTAEIEMLTAMAENLVR